MKPFRNLLVGIDVDAHGEQTAGSQPALAQALRLAQAHGARIRFTHVIDLPEPVRNVQTLQPQTAASRRQRQVTALLQRLVDTAHATGLQADSRLLYGQDWTEIVRTVLQDGHDLVIVGTRQRSLAGRALFGGTGSRLLRNCPCPVWCVKPGDAAAPRTVLVAHDLGDSGRAALDIGVTLARQYGARLHLLHVLELPQARQFLGSISPSELQLREQEAREALQRELSLAGITDATISVVTGDASAEILVHLQRHPVDLLCMGSIARSGLAGLVTGNTAENVLPWLNCSLVTVKPAGFVTPLLRAATEPLEQRQAGRSA